MPVDIHLLSNPGENDIRYILEACGPYLKNQAQPLVAFMQWASVSHNWLEYTRKAFAGLGEVAELVPDHSALAENEQILERCGVVYISGGNTWLLNHRLHSRGLFEPLRKRALAGLPLVTFSAGAILCGPNITTTHDINMVPTPHFAGLDLLPYNIVAHYPAIETEREGEDEWLSDYQAMHFNPILALENDAYARWDGKTLKLVRGHAWLLERKKPRRAFT